MFSVLTSTEVNIVCLTRMQAFHWSRAVSMKVIDHPKPDFKTCFLFLDPRSIDNRYLFIPPKWGVVEYVIRLQYNRSQSSITVFLTAIYALVPT